MRIRIKADTDWEKWRIKTFYDKEPETIAWIESFDGSIFWDIGANIGVYSLYCAAVNSHMVTYAFEPYQENFKRLWENIWLNDLVSIWPHFLAVSDTDSVSNFRQNNQQPGASGGQISKNSDGYKIRTFTGDKLAKMYGIPHYIKIDTDGNELEILQGMPKTLKSPKLKSVLVEINNNSEEITNILTNSGFITDNALNSLKNRDSDHNLIFVRKSNGKQA